jgi:dynein light intermediate chain
VVVLQEQLDLRLQQRQARETGICPIREELYAQCFDELIRQVTINCAERGLLLLRCRDELKMTVASNQTLYDSCIAFGLRKALQTEQSRADMLARIAQLEADCRETHKNAADLQEQLDALESQERQRRADAAQKHKEEVEFLLKHNGELKAELEATLSLPTEAAMH